MADFTPFCKGGTERLTAERNSVSRALGARPPPPRTPPLQGGEGCAVVGRLLPIEARLEHQRAVLLQLSDYSRGGLIHETV